MLEHVQNNLTTLKKVTNLKSEFLFREAEDCFLYFNQTKKALNKLNKSIELSPSHCKSLILKGDICFIKGKIEEALELYRTAEVFQNKNSKVLASIANCLEIKGKYKEALKYCDMAFLNITEDNCQLLSSLYDLKANLLLKVKKYQQAKKLISDARYNLPLSEIASIKSYTEVLSLKLKLLKRMETLNLQVL